MLVNINKFNKLCNYIEHNNYKTRPIFEGFTSSIMDVLKIAQLLIKSTTTESDEISTQNILVLNQALIDLYPLLKSRARQHVINCYCTLNDIEYNDKKTKNIEKLSTSLDLSLIQTCEMVKSHMINIDKSIICPDISM